MSLTQSQYNEIMRSYSQKQIVASSQCQARRELIYSKLPRLLEIEDEIAATSIAAAKAKIFDGQDNLDLHAQLEDLREAKLNILASAGYSLDDLEPKYTCPDCKDTGFIDNVKCHCFKRAENALIYDQSNLNDIEMESFENFDLSYYDRQALSDDDDSPYMYAEKALRECQNFVNNFGQESSNLLIYGETGVGKTFLCNCIAKELLSKNFSVIYLTAKELFDIINKSTFDKDIQAKASLDNLYTCDLLILDDLGTEFSNSFTSSQVYPIINERLLTKKSTLISSNLTVSDIRDKYTERVSSRIVGDYQILKLFGTDVRLAKRLK